MMIMIEISGILNSLIQLIDKLSNEGYHFAREENAKDLYFRRNIPSKYIIGFFRELSISTQNIHFDTKQIIDFLEKCEESILDKWDIVILEGDRKAKPFKLNQAMSVVPVERSFDMLKNRINISGRSGRLGSPTDARSGLTKEQIEFAKSNAEKNDDMKGLSTVKQEVWFKYVGKEIRF